jgi:hypothetical protein
MLEMVDYDVDYEVDWRLLAARDPGADLIDLLPVGPGPVDLDLPSDSPAKSLNSDQAMDEIIAAERRMAATAAGLVNFSVYG